MADVADPVPEPTLPPPVRTVESQRSGLGLIMGGVIAALIGFLLAQIVPQGWPLFNAATTDSKLAANAAEIKALKSTLEQYATTASVAGVTDRIAALESKAAVTAPADLSGIEQGLADLTKRVGSLETAPAATGTVPDAALSQLRAEVEALKTDGPTGAAIDSKLAAATAKITALEDDFAAKAQTASSHAALQRVAAALDSGQPFGAALGELAQFNPPAPLTDVAKFGVPSLQSLAVSFPDAARAALSTSLQANMGQSWTDRVSAYLRNQTGARSLTPRDGNDPDAILSRVEAAVSAGDLAAALTGIASLPPEGQAAMADWQARCKIRQDAIVALQSLTAAVEG